MSIPGRTEPADTLDIGGTPGPEAPMVGPGVVEADTRRRRRSGRRFGAIPMIGLVIFAALLLVSILAPLLPLADPLAQSLDSRSSGPLSGHLFGTDLVGRDVLSRTIYGGRSAFAGIGIAAAVMLLIGIPWGLIAGFSGTVVDETLMRIADALLSFPSLVLAIGVVSVLGPSMENGMVTVGVICSPVIARLLRAAVLPLRDAQFVQVAGSLGVTRTRVALRHVLPNAMAPVLVQTFALGAQFLIVQAALGFLGLGSPPPAPSWGQDMADAYMNFTSEPFATIVPGLAITLGAWSISAIGDGLRDVLVRS
ncbi:ABC transporter permease [Aeromicrobium sp. YIM 150415]|uniref:ABC transporter permease n=1 Tax=Aeromicrobium sp. YIM 150415 TaxID=2803912 RepID=UPI0019628E16|nr:ABC transporter permease [Aeromicrobium sp. YIM 150415]MBM9463995.1 ABC transporter permease [Aeromicrobium sp. YIM 150415]